MDCYWQGTRVSGDIVDQLIVGLFRGPKIMLENLISQHDRIQ